MAAETCHAMLDIMNADAENNEAVQLYALTLDQLGAIQEKLDAMEDDGGKESVQEYIDSLTEVLGGCICHTETEVHETWCPMYQVQTYPGGPGGPGGQRPGGDGETTQNECDISYWKGEFGVNWDESNATGTGRVSPDHIETVYLGDEIVNQDNSGNPSYEGTALSNHFPNASTTNNASASLSIKTDKGYYVTRIIVCCIDPTRKNPYSCETWKDDHAYDKTFDLAESTYKDGQYTLNIDVTAEDFSHRSNVISNSRKENRGYFILIMTAKVPTPLYVEYDYGVIDFLDVTESSAFNTASGWTVANDGNNYGNGEMHQNGILTANTQFAYQYPNNNTDVVSSWKHYANGITDAAKNEAANAGYYFAGWKATWYNKCEVTESTSNYNNYTMNFSDEYMSGTYQAGADVQLPCHVKLVAQWAPIELKISKTVADLDGNYSSDSHGYTIQLQKLNGETWDNVGSGFTFSVTGNASQEITLSADAPDVAYKLPITPGTYRVVESEESQGNLTKDGADTVMYFSGVEYSENVTYSTDNFNAKTLSVTNTYSAEPAKTSLTITKTVSGGLGDKNKSFAFTVQIGDGEPIEFTLAHNGEKQIENIPIGSTVIVTEAAYPDYTTTYQVNNELAVKENSVSWTAVQGENNTIAFENHKDMVPDSGVILDSLPYVLILVIVAGGAVLMLARKRRHGFED